MVATVGDPADPVFIHASKICGDELTSSYEVEKTALHLGFDWTGANCPTEVLGNYCPEKLLAHHDFCVKPVGN